MLKALVLSREFYEPRFFRSKIKTPLELLASSLRVLDAEVTAAGRAPEGHRSAESASPPYDRDRARMYGSGGTTASAMLAAGATQNQQAALSLRSLDEPVLAVPLESALSEMGQPLYLCRSPDGYSDRASVLVEPGLLMRRVRLAADLVRGRVPGVRAAPPAGNSTDANALLDRYLAGVVRPSTRVRLRSLCEKFGGLQTQIVATLVLGSPEFQAR